MAPKATDRIGRHLLGRRYVPDERDWTLDRLERERAARRAARKVARERRTSVPFDDSSADKTIRELRAEGTLSTWDSILIFWRWLKAFFSKPVPPVPPAPGETLIEWANPIQLDQGQTPHCVGFGWAGWGDALPVGDHYEDLDGHAIYYECKVIDGESLAEDGSQVRSGAKAMQARGRLDAYAFLTLEEAKAKIAEGPLVCGTDWTQEMFSPNVEGIVTPTGPVEGGHCYLLLGYDPDKGRFEFQNSWGAGWGKEGRFFMSVADFGKLLEDFGEVCYAAEL